MEFFFRPGHARNYLLPSQKAILASRHHLEKYSHLLTVLFSYLAFVFIDALAVSGS
jgi:hypothetical protein